MTSVITSLLSCSGISDFSPHKLYHHGNHIYNQGVIELSKAVRGHVQLIAAVFERSVGSV